MYNNASDYNYRAGTGYSSTGMRNSGGLNLTLGNYGESGSAVTDYSHGRGSLQMDDYSLQTRSNVNLDLGYSNRGQSSYGLGTVTKSFDDFGQGRRSFDEHGSKNIRSLDDLSHQRRSYDDLGQQTRSYEDLGQQTRSHDDLGQQTRSYDDLGQQTRSYDGLGQQTRSYDDMSKIATSRSYDDFGQKSILDDSFNTGNRGITDYGLAGRSARLTDSYGQVGRKETTRFTDDYGTAQRVSDSMYGSLDHGSGMQRSSGQMNRQELNRESNARQLSDYSPTNRRDNQRPMDNSRSMAARNIQPMVDSSKPKQQNKKRSRKGNPSKINQPSAYRSLASNLGSSQTTLRDGSSRDFIKPEPMKRGPSNTETLILKSELEVREQQLAMASSLLDKQTQLLQNLESNIHGGAKIMPGNQQQQRMMGNMQQQRPGMTTGGFNNRMMENNMPQRGRDPPLSPGGLNRNRLFPRKRSLSSGLSTGPLNKQVQPPMKMFKRDFEPNRGPMMHMGQNVPHMEKMGRSPGRAGGPSGEIMPNRLDLLPSSQIGDDCLECDLPIHTLNHRTTRSHVQRMHKMLKGCDQCGVRKFKCFAEYSKHWNSPEHTMVTKYQRLNVKPKIRFDRLKVTSIGTFVKTKKYGEKYLKEQKGMYCEVCKRFFPAASKESPKDPRKHLSSRIHYDNLINQIKLEKFEEMLEKQLDGGKNGKANNTKVVAKSDSKKTAEKSNAKKTAEKSEVKKTSEKSDVKETSEKSDAKETAEKPVAVETSEKSDDKKEEKSDDKEKTETDGTSVKEETMETDEATESKNDEPEKPVDSETKTEK